jgi:hypothetical protein
MSEIRGPLSGVGVPIADALRDYRALPPQRKSVAAVGFGAALLAEWVYLGPDFDGGLLGISGALADEVWVGVALLPLLWLFFTLRLARGQRDMLSAYGWLLRAALFAALLWLQVYPDPRAAPFLAFLLKGIYWAALAGNLARVFAAAQPFGGGSAYRLVAGEIARNEWDWNGPPRRRWWQFRRR